MTERTFTVTDDGGGSRLDRFLVSVMPDQSRSRIQRLIKEGRIRLAGRETRANQPLKPGQTISVDVPEPIEPALEPEPLPLAKPPAE